MKLYWYPRCSTCRAAKDKLDSLKLDYDLRDLVEDKLSQSELQNIVKQSGLELRRFFNTSGIKYRQLGLAKKRKDMTEDEQFEVLASDGMLVKRPILVTDDRVLLGFKEEEYNKL